MPAKNTPTCMVRGRGRVRVRHPPEGPTAVESAALDAADSSTRGGGRALGGAVSSPGSAEPPRAARRPPRRHSSRAGALPRRAL
eukprot:scaffold47038_cov46-Phaeocystis_antarctica.AAC.2